MPAVATAGGLPTRLGKYEIIMPLAVGGMARIYIGRTTGIGSFERHVVLKMITPEKERDQTAVFMFLDEARLAASLNHQNVAQVFEVGEEDGIHYLAMEYVHGQDLRSLLAKAGSQGTRVPLEFALTVVAGAASGLNHAHERRGGDGKPLGIVHRDVSPSNIMVGYDGAVKMLDFGIAKATSRSVETQSGIIKGKFAYMAPEQCRGREVDRRSDVFSLGIILYEISTQHRCFRADSDFDTMHRIVTGDVVRPTRLVQGYPPALEAIVMKALAVDANQRYQSAGALLEAIESYSVSARMSLSTMSLGRFMRDMFGDQLEPWLNNSFNSEESFEPKETTISNTNGTGGAVPAGQPRPANTTDPFPTNAALTVRLDALASATLELPKDITVREDVADESPEDAGSTTSFPTMPRPVAKPPAAMPVTAPMRAVGAPQAPALATSQPPMQALHTAPQGPFSPSPGFGQPYGAQPYGAQPYGAQPYPGPPSGNTMSAQSMRDQTGPVYAHPGASDAQHPSSPALLAYQGGAALAGSSQPSTRHGYASAGQTMDYPHASQPPFVDDDAHAGRLAPNRRPLIIGLLLAAVGMVVLLGVTIAGRDDSGESQPVVQPDDSDDRPPPAVTPPSGSKTTETTQPVPDIALTAGTDAPPTGVAQRPVGVAETTPSIPEPVSIKVDVESEPQGADVLLAGKVIGTTPLHTTLPRGAGRKELIVHKAGFVDSVKIIGLDENFMASVVLRKVEERKPTQGTKPPLPRKPACQNPAQVDPFDPRPVCK